MISVHTAIGVKVATAMAMTPGESFQREFDVASDQNSCFHNGEIAECIEKAMYSCSPSVQSRRNRSKALVALLLTFSAGMVDIVGYISVYHWFLAHMTGNTVHLGNKLAIGDWSEATKAATAIASFIGGSVVGRAIIEAGARRGTRTIASLTLALEAALIIAFIVIGRFEIRGSQLEMALPVLCLLLALLAGAMGMQTATLTHIGPLTIHTTFVTGMLNNFAEECSNWLFWIHDQWRDHMSLSDVFRKSPEQSAVRNAGFMLAIWLSYMLGSVVGTWMHARWQNEVLFVPVAFLLLSAGIDRWRPLALEEEGEARTPDRGKMAA